MELISADYARDLRFSRTEPDKNVAELNIKLAELNIIILQAIKKRHSSVFVECDKDFALLDKLVDKGFDLDCTVDNTKMTLSIRW